MTSAENHPTGPQPSHMHAARPRHTRLGRGLSSLIGHPVEVHLPAATTPGPHPSHDPATAAGQSTQVPSHHAAVPSVDGGGNAGPGITHIPISAIGRNPHQPRQNFDKAALEQLAASIRTAGVMQPVVVRPVAQADGPHTYELVAGERRLRAAQIAGLAAIPAVVRMMDDRQVAEWALIENLQREDLNPMERAAAFKNLLDHFGLSQDDIAGRIGVDRSSISNTLRLLSLAPPIQQLIRDGMLSMGQARAIAGVADPIKQGALALRTVRQGLSVRQVEWMAKAASTASDVQPAAPQPSTMPGPKSAHLRDLEAQISQQLNTRVRLRPGRKKGSGTISIEFYNFEQFDVIMNKLGVKIE